MEDSSTYGGCLNDEKVRDGSGRTKAVRKMGRKAIGRIDWLTRTTWARYPKKNSVSQARR